MKRLFIFLVAAVLVGSCAKEQRRTLASGTFDVSVQAALPELQMLDDDMTEESKAATVYTVHIKWTAGDKMSVINLTTGKILGGALTADATGVETTFSGSLVGTVSQGDALCYLYPSQGNTQEEVFTKATVNMSAQSGAMGSVPLCVSSIVTADGAGFNQVKLTFNYLMSYLMIGLSDIPASTQIKKVTITNVNNAFDLNINSSKNNLSIAPRLGDITLTLGQKASAAGARTVYVSIPGSSSVSARQAVIETSTTSFETKFTAAALSNGVAYNTNVSGFLVDDLVMSDSSMRDYCLEHFDTNGDGKLSMVEVAGITSFPDQSIYPIPSDVRRFNELEYFYGLTSLPSFKNCKQLESITIPKQITSIPSQTFYGCYTLNKLTLKPETPPTLGSDVFYGVASTVVLVVSDTSVSDYQVADGWTVFYKNFRTESSENSSSVDIETEDEDSMENDRVDIEIH